MVAVGQELRPAVLIIPGDLIQAGHQGLAGSVGGDPGDALLDSVKQHAVRIPRSAVRRAGVGNRFDVLGGNVHGLQLPVAEEPNPAGIGRPERGLRRLGRT